MTKPLRPNAALSSRLFLISACSFAPLEKRKHLLSWRSTQRVTFSTSIPNRPFSLTLLLVLHLPPRRCALKVLRGLLHKAIHQPAAQTRSTPRPSQVDRPSSLWLISELPLTLFLLPSLGLPSLLSRPPRLIHQTHHTCPRSSSAAYRPRITSSQPIWQHSREQETPRSPKT
jgi:hypothetical protein